VPAAKTAKPQPPAIKPALGPEAPPAAAQPAEAAPPIYPGDRIALAVWLTGAMLIAGLLLADLVASLFRLLLRL
jgi:hypothetical protein